MLKNISKLFLVLIALLAVACSGDDNNLPTAPETGLSAGWAVTVTPPTVSDGDCRIRFVGSASGGKAGYAFLWDFGALPVRAKQRVGSDKDQTVEFVTTSSAIGIGAYGTSLTVTDSKQETRKVSGFVAYNCAAGASPTTFSF